MDIATLKSRLKSGEVGGWYIFAGEEDYLKRYYLAELRRAIVTDEVFSTFNHLLIDGADIDFAELKEAVKSPPMMSDYKLIEWKFANLDGLKESEKATLLELISLKEEYPTTVFAIMTSADGFDIGTEKRPSRLASRLSDGFDIINFSKSTDAQLLSWLKRHFDAEGILSTADVLNALIFRSGRSMEVLNGEVNKLSAFVKSAGRDTLLISDVESVASSTSESDAFLLSNAVIERNMEKAFSALSDLKERRVEPAIVLAMLERTYSELLAASMLIDEGGGVAQIESILKLHPFKAKLYAAAAKRAGTKRLAESSAELRRIDAASKSGGLSGYVPIEMFITRRI